MFLRRWDISKRVNVLSPLEYQEPRELELSVPPPLEFQELKGGGELEYSVPQPLGLQEPRGTVLLLPLGAQCSFGL